MGSWGREVERWRQSVLMQEMCLINVVGGSVECGVPYRSFAVFSTSHSDLHLPKVTVFVQPVLFMRGVIVNYNLGDVI